MAAISKPRSQGSKRTLSIWVIALLTSIIVYQIASRSSGEEESYPLLKLKHQLDDASFEYGLAPPRGKAIALPSIRVAKEEFKSDERYGGKGDKSHLGGFTDMDHHGISPAVWKWMMTYIGVHSILDVGCGRGISTSWFYFHGADVLCVEGSHDAIENTVIPDTSRIVEHDFSRGPWWPEKTYDAVWCVEFLEHVRRNIVYIPSDVPHSKCLTHVYSSCFLSHII
jgi:Methyltransferase domain